MCRLVFATCVLFLLILFGAWVVAGPARAAESLSFADLAPDDVLALRALSLLEKAAPEVAALNATQTFVARADLNGDAAPELFLRVRFLAQACTGSCRDLFFVFVGREEGLRLVARLPAFDLRIADTLTGGVRDLMVYADPGNDYGWAKYVWEPLARRYGPQRLNSRALSGPEGAESGEAGSAGGRESGAIDSGAAGLGQGDSAKTSQGGGGE